MKFACLPLLIFFILMASPGEAMEDPKPAYRIRGDENFAPFEFLDREGNPSGFDIDILRAVAEVMDLDIELSLGPWEEVREDLEAGSIDALAGMRYSEDRALWVDFSSPYLINSSAIFVRADSAVQTLEDLRGKEVVVQVGDIMDDQIRTMNLTSSIVVVQGQNEALELLATGKHDAALCSRLRGLYLIRERKLDNLVAVGPALAGAPYGFAVAEGNQTLLARLNEGLRILKETGQYDEIYQRWFGLYEKQSLSKDLLRYALWVLTPMLLLLAGALAWSWALRRQVAVKTGEITEHLEERQRAEAKLEAEREFRQYVEASPVPMAIIDGEQRILYVNHKFSELFGYSLEELPDTPTWWSLACPDPARRQQVLESWDGRFHPAGTTLSSGQPLEMEVACKNGAMRYVICRHSSFDHRHFIVFNDITQRKLAEQALEYRSRVERMLAAISTRFVNLAPGEVDQEIDRALQEIGEEIGVDRSYVFQFSDDGQTLTNSHEWCAPEIEPQKCSLQGISTHKYPWFLQQLKNEGIFYSPSVARLGSEAREEREEWLREGIQSLIAVAMVLEGKMIGFIGFDSVQAERNWPEEIPFLLSIVGESIANAQERCRREEALRLAHQQLHDIIDFLPDATFVIDRQGRVVAWNRAIEEMTGTPKGDILGQGDYAYAVPFYGERRPILIDLIQNPASVGDDDYTTLLREKQAFFVEMHLSHLYGGRGAYVLAKASLLFDREGELIGAIESIRDISERKAEQEKLETVNRDLEAFVYTVSHDLRSPLTPILGYADFLQETYRDRLDEMGRKCLAEISASANKMLRLMEDLLSLAKIGQLPPPEKPVDTRAVVEDILNNLSAQIERTGTSFKIDDLPAVRIPWTLLFQVFENLIGNALSYAGRQGSPIEIGGRRRGHSVEIYVRDHGPGIAAEDRERIFDVFYRGAGGEVSPGTGIGLATVQKIARQYDGKARVTETPGGGATFWLEIMDTPTTELAENGGER